MTSADIRVEIRRYERLRDEAEDDSRLLARDLWELEGYRDQYKRVTDAIEDDLARRIGNLGLVTIDTARVRSAATFLEKTRAVLLQGDMMVQNRKDNWRLLVRSISEKEEALATSRAAEKRYENKIIELRIKLREAEDMEALGNANY